MVYKWYILPMGGIIRKPIPPIIGTRNNHSSVGFFSKYFVGEDVFSYEDEAFSHGIRGYFCFGGVPENLRCLPPPWLWFPGKHSISMSCLIEMTRNCKEIFHITP